MFNRRSRDFVEGALYYKIRHDLLAQVGENCQKYEDGECLILKSLKRIGRFPEGEADEHCLLQG